MNIKKYFLLSNLKKLPLYIIMTVTLIAVALISASNINFIRTINTRGYYYGNNINSGVGVLLYFFFIFMMILPFFNMNYRYSLAKSDTYRQAPFADKTIRFVDHLSTLIIILIGFTIAYATFVGVVAIHNFNTPVPSPNEYFTYELIVFNYFYFVPLYFGCIIGGFLEYFISYFLISRSNNFLNSLLILIFGQGFLACFIMIPMSFVKGLSIVTPLESGASFLFPPTYLYNLFNGFIVEGTNYYQEHLSLDYYPVEFFGVIIAGISFVSLGALSIADFILEKDPSSEWAGKVESDKPYQEIIFHLGAFAIMSMISIAMFHYFSYVDVLFFVVFSSISYFTLYGLLHRSFRFKSYQVWILVSLILTALLIGFAFRFRYLFEVDELNNFLY